MTNKHKKEFQPSIVIKEMKITTTRIVIGEKKMSSTRMAAVKKNDIPTRW